MSNGTIVDIPNWPSVTPGAPTSLIVEKFNTTMGYAAAQIVQANNYTEQLVESITTLGMPDTWLTALQDIEVPSVNPVSPGTRARPADMVLPDDWPEDFPNLPTLRSVPTTDLSFTSPVKPDDVSPTLNYVAGVYNSSLYTAIYNRIYDILQNGSSGLNADVEAAILARRREQQRLSNAKKYDDDMRTAGATGFNFPAGMISAISTDSSTEVLRQDTDFNNAILIQAYESEQKAYFFALEKSINLEQILRDFYGKTEDRSFEQQKAISQFIITVYAEKVKAFITEWEGIKTELEAKKATVELVLSENTMLVDAFKAEAVAYTSKVESISKKIEGIVKGYEGEVTAYDADTRALESYYRSLDSQQQLLLNNAEIKLKKATAELDFLLKNKIASDSLTERIAEAAAHIAQQGVASALNSVNASTSLCYGGSDSRSESIAHHEQLTESHSYEEDTAV
jgi:hypothetical protein